MGSYLNEDDIYFAYGSIFQDKNKVVFFLRNYQLDNVAVVEQVTTSIHEMFTNDKLNPLGDNKLVSDKLLT